MKKTIITLAFAIVVMAFFLNTNSVNDPNSSLNLVSLTTMNSANAETTVDCYGSYTLEGKWVIVKCNGCVQQAHVTAYEQKSTCTK